MADEIEIKLRVPPEALKAVPKLGWLKAMAQGPAKRKILRSVYFDTAKCKLKEQGLTLRVRHAGAKRLQTVKAEGKGVFARQEWECEISGDKPDLKALPALKQFSKLAPKLRTVFETEVTRTVLMLQHDGTVMELALDLGTLKAGRSKLPISEIEIELKEGDPKTLVIIAERLAESFPATYEVQAKSERGYTLAAGATTKPSHARGVMIEEDWTTADAFRAIGMECLRHLASNDAAVRAGETEGVHQMRVGLRRLRAAFSVFKEMLADPESLEIKTELKWLTEQLGPARDFDVFVRESVAPLAQERTEMAVLKEELEGRRDKGFSRAKTAVDSARYRKLVLRIALWLADGAWSRDGDLLQQARRDRPILSFAAETLDTRLHKITRKAHKLEKLDPHRRHKLRIHIKKLRYASEFFAALFAAHKARHKRLRDILEELQDALGRLNDFAVHRKLAGEIVGKGKEARRAKEAFAMGMVTCREEASIETSLAAARKAGSKLKAVKAFWP